MPEDYNPYTNPTILTPEDKYRLTGFENHIDVLAQHL